MSFAPAGQRFVHSIASSRELTQIIRSPQLASFVSANGPSVIVTLPPASDTLAPAAGGVSPWRASKTPALRICSLYPPHLPHRPEVGHEIRRHGFATDLGDHDHQEAHTGSPRAHDSWTRPSRRTARALQDCRTGYGEFDRCGGISTPAVPGTRLIPAFTTSAQVTRGGFLDLLCLTDMVRRILNYPFFSRSDTPLKRRRRLGCMRRSALVLRSWGAPGFVAG